MLYENQIWNRKNFINRSHFLVNYCMKGLWSTVKSSNPGDAKGVARGRLKGRFCKGGKEGGSKS